MAASLIIGAVTFIALAILPFVDEMIGRWQFRRLCTSEEMVWLGPTAGKVVAAKLAIEFSDRKGFVFPIREQHSNYVDAATGVVFYSVKAFHTPGGLLLRAGLGMGNSKSCWPEDWTSRGASLKLDELLKRGEQ